MAFDPRQPGPDCRISNWRGSVRRKTERFYNLFAAPRTPRRLNSWQSLLRLRCGIVTLLAGFVVNSWGHNRGLTVASDPSLVRDDRSPRLPRQDFAPNLSAKRRLCNTVGGRIVEGCAACCCALSAARSRAATTTNLARSSLALVFRAIFGGAKSCALVNLFMICPRWSAGG
jgi:hypothetical protein